MGLGTSKEDNTHCTDPTPIEGSANPNFGQGESETNFVERNERMPKKIHQIHVHLRDSLQHHKGSLDLIPNKV